MTTDPPSLRSMQAQIAALTRAATTDGSEISAPARRKFLANFENGHKCSLCGTIPINADLPPDQKARAVAAAMSVHFRRLALRSRMARGRARQLYVDARKAERQLDEELAQLDDRAAS